MAEDDAARMTCPDCGRKYRWSERYAGRRVRCKCGHTMHMPEEPPSSEASAAGMYSLTDGDGLGTGSAGQCPSCGGEMAADAVICIECGYNSSTGQQMGEATTPRKRRLPGDEARAEAERRIERAEAVRSIWVPFILLILGVILTVFQAYVRSTIDPFAGEMYGEDESLVYEEYATEAEEAEQLAVEENIESPAVGEQMPADQWPDSEDSEVMIEPSRILTGSVTIVGSLIRIIVETMFGVALMIGVCFVAAKALDTGFGALWTAILKLAAIYVAPGALGAIVGMYVPDAILSFMAQLIIPVGLYYWLLSWLFDLDLFETVVTATIMWVIETWIVIFLVALFWVPVARSLGLPL